MSRVRLLHWNPSEAATYVELLRTAGYDVEYDNEFRPGMMRPWRESPPRCFRYRFITAAVAGTRNRDRATAITSPAARPHCLLRGSGREGRPNSNPAARCCLLPHRNPAFCPKTSDCKPAQRASETDGHDGQICFKNCRSETRDQGIIDCSTDRSSARLRKGAWRNACTHRILGT
jgi:hypothetical protein